MIETIKQVVREAGGRKRVVAAAIDECGGVYELAVDWIAKRGALAILEAAHQRNQAVLDAQDEALRAIAEANKTTTVADCRDMAREALGWEED